MPAWHWHVILSCTSASVAGGHCSPQPLSIASNNGSAQKRRQSPWGTGLAIWQAGCVLHASKQLAITSCKGSHGALKVHGLPLIAIYCPAPTCTGVVPVLLMYLHRHAVAFKGGSVRHWHSCISLDSVHASLKPFHLPRLQDMADAGLVMHSCCACNVQVAATVKVAMPPYQAVIYNWVMRTGTLKSDPEAAVTGTRRPHVTLNNKCMELRKVGWRLPRACMAQAACPVLSEHEMMCSASRCCAAPG